MRLCIVSLGFLAKVEKWAETNIISILWAGAWVQQNLIVCSLNSLKRSIPAIIIIMGRLLSGCVWELGILLRKRTAL